MRSSLRVAALVLACLGGAVASARAQDAPDPGEDARLRLGALRFTPSIVFSSLGVDNNVFNEAENPRQDTTAAVGPAVDLWMNMGRSRLSAKVGAQYLYFKQYDNQRAWNTVDEARWDLPLNRIAPFMTGTFRNTKERPGYEIDSRIRLKEGGVGLGTTVRLSNKTELVLGGQRSQFQYDDDLILGDQVGQRLDRRTDAEDLQFRLKLTPLTTFVLKSKATQERFDTQEVRDGNTFSVMPGFELKPQALISGTVFVGVKQFTPLRDAVPAFTGVVADVSAKYILRSTQIEPRVTRDLVYSYELLQPYYALTDFGATVTERVTSKWDIVGHGSRQALAYRNMTIAESTDARTDHSWQLGGGFGYRVSELLRLGIDANYSQRKTESLDFRNYEGLRIGASFSYGLPQ